MITGQSRRRIGLLLCMNSEILSDRRGCKHGIPTTVGGEGGRITEFFNFRSANSFPKTTRPHGFESVHSSGQIRLHRIESCSLPSCDPCHPPHLRLRSGILDQRSSAAPMVLHSAAHQGAIQPADALKASRFPCQRGPGPAGPVLYPYAGQ